MSNAEEEEGVEQPDSGEATEWPPYKYALRMLEERGRLQYGSVIDWDELEKLINRGPRNFWPFRNQYVSLCAELKKMGFISTERGMNDRGIRILERLEMADYIRQKETQKANNSLLMSLSLSKVPRDGLKENEAKKLDHWETKTAVIGATSKVLLRKRTLPAPQKVIETVKQASLKK